MGSLVAFPASPHRLIARKTLLLTFAILSGLDVRSAVAQESTPYTLHVYTNLAQQPVMVLDQDNKPLLPFTREQFSLSLDHGPPFHPTHMRMEGDDPISLAVLLDVSGSADDLMKVAEDAIAGLAPWSLTPRDHVAIFAFDCTLSQPNTAVPANIEALKTDVREAVHYPGVHGSKSAARSCYRSTRLWDSLMMVTHSISAMPGRRVILAITDGLDHDSKATWNDVRENAAASSISIFGIRADTAVLQPFGSNGYRSWENRFQLLCNGSGGLVLQASPKTLPKTLQHVIELLRSRYILEYPRPSNATSGLHLVEIKVPNREAVILAPGVTIVLASGQELHDPNTIPPDLSKAPILGTRKPMSH
jgi:VWFA-related protein